MALAIHMLAMLLLALAFGRSLALALPARQPARPVRRASELARLAGTSAPRFTAGGLIGDHGGILALLALLLALPRGDAAFWLIAMALSLMLASHLLLWTALPATGGASPERHGSLLARAGLALLGLLAVAAALGV
ncbi:MAG: hypothetical protein AB7G10_26435 [Reyranellaceae bacterium]